MPWYRPCATTPGPRLRVNEDPSLANCFRVWNSVRQPEESLFVSSMLRVAEHFVIYGVWKMGLSLDSNPQTKAGPKASWLALTPPMAETGILSIP